MEIIMNTLKSWMLCGAAILLSAADHGIAQSPASLELQLFPGVNITGTVGSIYVVQSTSDLAQTNSWVSVAFIQLPATNYLFVDTTVPCPGQSVFSRTRAKPAHEHGFHPAQHIHHGQPDQ